jgi:hypothetical protein
MNALRLVPDALLTVTTGSIAEISIASVPIHSYYGSNPNLRVLVATPKPVILRELRAKAAMILRGSD